MIKYAIWGTGKNAKIKFERLKKINYFANIQIVGFIDNNVQKWGGYFKGKNIYSPSELKNLHFDFIDIWVQRKKDEVEIQIIEELKIPNTKIKDIFDYYRQEVCEKYKNSKDEEIKEFIKIFRKKKEVGVFAYEPSKIDEMREVFFDEKYQLNYVYFEGKRLYLARKYKGFAEVNGRKFLTGLWQEQDKNSPHLYEDNQVTVSDGDVLVDAGVCEGNFSLHNIEKVKRVYLVECESEWMEALKATFDPYKDKVVFCNKFLSDRDTGDTITLDSLVDGPVNFIKMDIEGEEVNALKGAERVLSENKNLKCSICSYHKHGDEEKIRSILGNKGFKSYTSKGYMLFIYDDEIWRNPELRRGVVRGYK